MFMSIVYAHRRENVVIVAVVLCGVQSVCRDGLLADKINTTQKPG